MFRAGGDAGLSEGCSISGLKRLERDTGAFGARMYPAQVNNSENYLGFPA